MVALAKAAHGLGLLVHGAMHLRRARKLCTRPSNRMQQCTVRLAAAFAAAESILCGCTRQPPPPPHTHL